MILLAVSSSMQTTDVAPSRLERAKQKIRDLLAARTGARTGLIAYSGSAHLVMPLTDDRTVIEPFLAALAPALMPSDGKNVAAAIGLAADGLAREAVAGTILLVADDLGSADEAALRKLADRAGLVMLAVAMQSPPGWPEAIRVSIDQSDIRALERRIETRYQAAQADELGTRWLDEGYWLLLPASFLCLMWFRRGTVVQWILLFVLLAHGTPARAEGACLRTLWFTPDQQSRIAFDRGDDMAAKTLFADPMWRGIAAYRAFDFLAAAEAFAKVDTPEGRFALGNAQAQNHAYEKAIKAYQDVLAAQPGNAAAKINLAIVQAALQRQEEKRRKQEEGESPPDEKADEMRVDPQQKGGKRIQVTPEDVTTAGAAEAWMRAVQTSPADFLKLKFAIQAAAPLAPTGRRP
jgi:Ca-activated chloride channel family protein